MDARERFLSGLTGGQDAETLLVVLDEITAEAGPVVAIECLDAWIENLQLALAPGPEVRERYRALAKLHHDAAEAVADAPARTTHWQKALDIHQKVLGDEDAARVVAATLLAEGEGVDVDALLEAAGGPSALLDALRKTVRAPHIKGTERALGYREALMALSERFGDKDRAFLESLKVLRAAPSRASSVDESVRLAMETERFTELVAVLGELTDAEDLSAPARARMCTKLGVLFERGLDDPGSARDAFLKALAIDPSSKAARRHATRLSDALGLPMPGTDAPPISFEDTAAPEDQTTLEQPRESTPARPAPPPVSFGSVEEATEIDHQRPAPEVTAVDEAQASAGPDPSWDEPAEAHALSTSGEGLPAPEDVSPPVQGVPPATAPDPLETTVPRAPRPGLLRKATPSLVDRASDESQAFGDDEATPLLADPPDVDDALDNTATSVDTPAEASVSTADVTPSAKAATASAGASVEPPEQESPAVIPSVESSADVEEPRAIDKPAAPAEPAAGAEPTDAAEPPPEEPPAVEPPAVEEPLAAEKPSAPAPAAVAEPAGEAPVDVRPPPEEPAVDQAAAGEGPAGTEPPPEEPAAVPTPPVVETPAEPAAVASPALAVAPPASPPPKLVAEDNTATGTATVADPAPADDGLFVDDATAQLPLADVTATGEAPLSSSSSSSSEDPQKLPSEEEVTERSPGPPAAMLAPDARPDADPVPWGAEPFEADESDAEMTTPAWPPSDGALRPEIAHAFSEEDAAEPLKWAADESVASAERLALFGRALELQAPEGALSDEAQFGFVTLAPEHPELSLVWARRLYEAAPPGVVKGAPDFWIQIARVQDDVDDVFSFLAPIAAADEIVARYLDDRLGHGGRAGLRLDLARRRLAHLEGKPRLGPLRIVAALSEDLDERKAVFEELAVGLRRREEDVLAGAVEVFARSEPEERARVYGRIVRHLPKARAFGVWEQLLVDRTALGDAVGREQAAKALLDFDAHHKDALDVLVELTEKPGPDAKDHETWLRRRMQVAVTMRDEATRRALFVRLWKLLEGRGAHDEALESLRAEVRTHPDHAEPREALLTHLLETSEVGEAVGVLDEAARRAPAEERAPFWVRAAELSRDRLKKRGRAQAFLDRALELSPHHIPALLLRAELAVDVGDPAGALQPLERLAAHTGDKRERAQIHHRIGVLLEEHLLRADDALRRYEVAAELDPTNTEAWTSLRELAGRKGETEVVARALDGLAAAQTEGPARAKAYATLATFEKDRGQPEAAARAWGEAVKADPADHACLSAWLAEVAALHDEADESLAKPSSGFLDDVAALLEVAVFDDDTPFEVRRLRALSRAAAGDGRARDDFSALLDERPKDPVSLSHILRLDSESTPGDRRRDLLERYLVHHGDGLTADERGRLWGDLAVARAAEDDGDGAATAMRKAAAQTVREGADALSLAALELGLKLFDGDDEETLHHRLRFLQARAKHKDARAAARDLTEAGRLAHSHLADRGLARALYEEAAALDDEAKEPRERMVELDIDEGKTEDVLTSLDELLARIGGGPEAADLHVEKAALFRKLGEDAQAAEALRRAIDEDATNVRALDMAEAVFTAQSDAKGLEELYLTQLKLLSSADTPGRVSILERLSQVRRYDLRDLRGAAEALEAIAAVDHGALKAREDAARIYAEIGALNQAMDKWREVLALDPFSPDAWRALLALMRRGDRPDGVFVVLAAMVASDLASPGHRTAHRNTRPPFPHWPVPPKDMGEVSRRLAHPSVRTPIRTVFTLLSDILLRELGPSFGPAQPKIAEHRLPRSVQQALRAAQALAGCQGIVLVESPHDDGFAPVHAAVPTLAVGAQVIKGGMTPQRAFDLGRAAGALSAPGRVVQAADQETLRTALTALVAAFATREADVPQHDQALAGRLRRAVDTALAAGGDDERRAVEDAVRQYAHARHKLNIVDFVRGIDYTGHRLGLLLCSDLVASTAHLRSTERNARRLVTELIRFSISADYLALRDRLGLAIAPDAGQQLMSSPEPGAEEERP